ncbi:arginase family protein [cf. Phormidesmis sp. LEGE 11477]|nr:arginase family protein [cf. Phormidesmis sp. LEGE 11477]
MTSRLFSTLVPNQIFLVGTRELDESEQAFISRNRLRIFSVNSVNQVQNYQLLSAISAAGFRKIYIHLDLDVLEPTSFPHVVCRTPKGISVDRLKQLLSELIDRFEVVGGSVLEFLPVESSVEGTIVASSFVNILQL